MFILWIKAFHIIAVVTWFAALFYLPRLFVYHSLSTDTASISRFKTMERRLYKGIMMPSFVLATSLGFWLIFDNLDYYLTQTWLHIKLLFAICLIAYHFYCGYLVKIFYSDKNVYSAKFYRWFNEIPTLILIIMVVLAVVKPF